MKKTIRIEDILSMVNRRNKQSICDPRVREGWNSLLEEILEHSGCYDGYGYLPQNSVPAGEKPGIIPSNSDRSYAFPDPTRRVYYQKLGLARRPGHVKI